MTSTVIRAGQFIDGFRNPMTMPRGAGEGGAGGEARSRNKRWQRRAGCQGNINNAGHEAKAPMKRRRWKNRGGRGNGRIKREVKAVRQCWRGCSRVHFWAVRGKRPVPLMWWFGLKNGDAFESKPPRHHFTWIVVRAPCEPGSSEWGSTQGTGS
jgi:hypothetical protein